MADWARGHYGFASRIVNHSGLTDRSRLPPAVLLDLLIKERERLPTMLRERPILDDAGQPLQVRGLRMVCKTGTLNFASGRAGYLLTARGRSLGFVILAADLAERSRVAGDLSESPPGAAAWEKRARAQEQALLRRWAALHAD
jgi:D-alanyl-D-alanine carboxypeptidase/D-alanyl-D-alanine-endopeptidase (penicillin-binding protein 4)